MYENLLLCTNSCDSGPVIFPACKLYSRSTQYLFTLMQSLEHLNAVDLLEVDLTVIGWNSSICVVAVVSTIILKLISHFWL